jgi:hypothetical protein
MVWVMATKAIAKWVLSILIVTAQVKHMSSTNDNCYDYTRRATNQTIPY